MTYKKGGRAEYKKGKELTEQIAAIAQVPGGLEMLMTMAAEKLGGPKGGKTKQLRLYNMGGAVKGYQQGGLSQIMEQQQGTMGQQAEQVRQAGRGDDEMLLHLAPEEYEAITSMWGPPEINPNTGIPEYGFLSKLWKGVKKTVKKIVKSPLFSFIAPIALNIFAPGLGTAIGGWLGATGKAAAVLGNTLVRTGIGAISGGKTGAISGALSGLTAGGVGADIGKKLGLKGATARIAGDALLGGAAGAGTGVGFQAGATGQAMQSLMGDPTRMMEEKITDIGKGIFGKTGEFDVTPGGLPPGTEGIVPDEFGYTGFGDVPGPIAAPQEGYYLGEGQAPAGPGTSVFGTALPEAVADPSMWERATGWMGDHPFLTAGGALAVGSMLGGGGGDQGPGETPFTLPPEFTEDLPNLSFDRTQLPVQDYRTYGQVGSPQQGEASFFDPNVIPSTSTEALPGLGGAGASGGIRPVEVGDQNSPQAMELAAQGWTFRGGYMLPPGLMGLGSRMGAMAALGGLVQKYQAGGHVRGPGSGRSDDIPAVLSDGEYVIDSEAVALLGDGSTDEGARRLDEMRANLRKHKGSKLSKGGFSAKARKPEKYMQEGGAVYIPPEENPHKKGTARYKMWERKYGKKKKKPEKKGDKKDDDALVSKVERYKSRTQRELEKLGEGLKKGGEVKSTGALKELSRLANKLETAITTGNKKRSREIAAQLDSLSDGSGKRLLESFARGGLVKKFQYDRGKAHAS